MSNNQALQNNSSLVAAPKLPEKIWDYDLVKILGQGSYGVVCEYEHEETKDKVAVKLEQTSAKS